MFVTTAGRTNLQMIEKAIKTAEILGAEYFPRNKRSIQSLTAEKQSACLVVGKERLELFEKDSNEPFFFHPNSAMFRIKRIIDGGHDPFAAAARLTPGMSFLDCTLGLASDSIVASYLIGNSGSIIGLEAQKYLAFIVKAGLQSWDTGRIEINEAMKRIHVINQYSFAYLQGLLSNSIDCVYFDPMFEERIVESDGINPLSQFAVYEELDAETIQEAIRVARVRVVLKDHYKSARFEKFGFHVLRRKTAKFHFGWIEK